MDRNRITLAAVALGILASADHFGTGNFCRGRRYQPGYLANRQKQERRRRSHNKRGSRT